MNSVFFSLSLVAIGGGELGQLETLKIDQVIVKSTGKTEPVALFIPTASQDSFGYWENFQNVYKKILGCNTDVLFLIREKLSSNTIQKKISKADLIYVGGGNTRKMLEVWRNFGVDQMLISAAHRGTILSGLSAGAICWFRYGNSDAPMLEGLSDMKTIRVNGLSLVNAALCPHMKRENFRLSEFLEMMRKTPGVGVGLDDQCALEIKGNNYRIISSDSEAKAYKIYWTNNYYYKEDLYPEDNFRSLDELLTLNQVEG